MSYSSQQKPISVLHTIDFNVNIIGKQIVQELLKTNFAFVLTKLAILLLMRKNFYSDENSN